jgi:hypothetical protein
MVITFDMSVDWVTLFSAGTTKQLKLLPSESYGHGLGFQASFGDFPWDFIGMSDTSTETDNNTLYSSQSVGWKTNTHYFLLDDYTSNVYLSVSSDGTTWTPLDNLLFLSDLGLRSWATISSI